MSFKSDVDRGIQQGMSRTHESSQRLALRRHKGLFERDAFVALNHGLPDAEHSIAIANGRGNVGYFVAPWLTLLDRPAQRLGRLNEEGFNVVRLQPTSLGALHVLANTLNASGVHGVVHERMLLNEILQARVVERLRN